jgi:hypothetical protein
MYLGKRSWGPALWRYLHVLAATADEPSLREQLEVLTRSLPCEECREHFVKYMHLNPPTLETPLEASRWMWAFHNSVNARLRKPQYPAERLRQDYGVDIAPRAPARPAPEPGVVRRVPPGLGLRRSPGR